MVVRSPLLDLLAIFVLIYVFQFVAGLFDVMGGFFVLSPPITENPWTVITSVYAHENVWHLISNAVALVMFGFPVAAGTTRTRFHLFFLTTGATAGVSQILVTGALAGFPIVGGTATTGVLGASGAVFALLGYLLASNRLATGLGSVVDPPTWLTYLVFFGLAATVTVATAQPDVALVAHFSGLLLGLIAGRFHLLASPDRQRGSSRKAR